MIKPRSLILSSIVEGRDIWSHLGWRDLKVRYSATRFGPWWSVANLSVIVLASSLAVSLLSGRSTLSSIPKITLGLTLWTFISASIIESTHIYEESKGLLLNTTLDETAVVLRLVWRNWIVLLHNFTVVVIVFALFKREAILKSLLILPLSVLTALILIFPSLLISRLVYWKADLRAIVPPLVQITFFLTPVLWIAPTSGPGRILLELNPAAWILHLSEQLILGIGSPWGYLLRVSLLFLVSFLLSEFVNRKHRSIKKLL